MSYDMGWLFRKRGLVKFQKFPTKRSQDSPWGNIVSLHSTLAIFARTYSTTSNACIYTTISRNSLRWSPFFIRSVVYSFQLY